MLPIPAHFTVFIQKDPIIAKQTKYEFCRITKILAANSEVRATEASMEFHAHMQDTLVLRIPMRYVTIISVENDPFDPDLTNQDNPKEDL